MNTTRQLQWFCAALGIVLALPLRPATGANSSALGIGGRYHTENNVFSDLPYGNADISYSLAYSITENHIALQLGLDFAPDVSGSRDAPDTNRTDYAVSPQINLIVKDRMFRGGLGLLTTYIRDDQDNGSWMDPYWQLLLGLEIPLGESFSLSGTLYYVLENWEDIADFRLKEIEYGVALNYNF